MVIGHFATILLELTVLNQRSQFMNLEAVPLIKLY